MIPTSLISKNKIMIGLLIITSFSLSYYKYAIKKDYLIEARLPCSPITESCFEEECFEDDVRCVNVGESFFFKEIKKSARSTIPLVNCSKDANCETTYNTTD